MKKRTIQFRALSSEEDNEWFYWDFPDEMDLSLVDIRTITQFTGLKDKKHKQIYEGDIVKIHNLMGTGVICTIISEKSGQWVCEDKKNDVNWGLLACCLCEETDGKNRVEIIGNIFQNRKLLKEGLLRHFELDEPQEEPDSIPTIIQDHE